jgi:predicted RecA/RadA family phage recombinase
MLTVFVHEGDVIDYTPVADLALGDVVVQGELVTVAIRDAKAGELTSLATEGVFDFPKPNTAGSAFAGGVKGYWDAANKKAVNVDGGGANKYIGKSTLPAADGDKTVRIRLQQ